MNKENFTNHMTSIDVIDFVSAYPRVTIETDKNTLIHLRTRKDACGKYIWSPTFYGESVHGSICGIVIVVVEECCLRKRYKFDSGEEVVVSFTPSELTGRLNID